MIKKGSTGKYYDYVEEVKKELPADQQAKYASRHGWSAPFVWLEMPDGTRNALGGRDGLCEWVLQEFPADSEVSKIAAIPPKASEAKNVSARPGSIV